MNAKSPAATVGSALWTSATPAKAARVVTPAPGIVLGNYPERRNPKPPSALARLLQPLLRSASMRDDANFVHAVRTMQSQLAEESFALFNQRIDHLRARLSRDGFVGPAITEACAIVAACCERTLNVKLYDTQLIAARIMLDGHLAEMATGEGKTLAAAVTASTAALAGIPVHVVTANDYLVSRDAVGLRPLYQTLGLTVGVVTQAMPAAARRDAYACNITYCTAKELVFDYLRDGVSTPLRSAIEQRAAALAGEQAPQRLLRGLCMAIIDEADSILIDEARVPLVLSRATADAESATLHHAWQFSAKLDAAAHYLADTSTHSTRLTAAGCAHLHDLYTQVSAPAGKWRNQRHCEDQTALALTARHLLQRGRDYVVEAGRVHIVDAITGRKAEGRSWSNGLHQLVEIKEHCKPSPRLDTLAQITYQRFFPRYFRLCGMSGTLRESRRELHALYNLQVVGVPLHRPARRTLLTARVFSSAAAQWRAVVSNVQQLHQQGRPVLVGTDSVLDSEALSQQLTASGLKHTVLNANQDQHEAAIIAAAGAPGAITVATNMAGRGTDIVLAEASRAAGGLHLVCCQQNTSRRIDRQLLGRCARHGDPGSAQYFLSLAGPMLASSRILRLLQMLFENNMLCNTSSGDANKMSAVLMNRLPHPCPEGRGAFLSFPAGRGIKAEGVFLILLGALNKLAMTELRQAQRSTERRHEIERAALMRQDKRLSDWFAFSGPEQ